jgi:hypothetical protein
MPTRETLEVARKAQDFYERHLRQKLEATDLNAFVAIEPESGEYFLGHTLSEAAQKARSAFPNRKTFTLRVGHTATVHIGAWNL